MATVATTSVSNPLQYPAETLVDWQTQAPPIGSGVTTGHLFAMIPSSTSNRYDLYRSTDNGVSWSMLTNRTRANVADVGVIHIDKSGYLHWLYRTNESSEDRVYYTRYNSAANTWTAELLVANAGNGGSAGSVLSGIDFITANYANGWQTGFAAVGAVLAGKHSLVLSGVTAGPTGVPYLNNNTFSGPRQYAADTGTGRVTPSVDLEHTGDGKTSSVPCAWVSFGRTRLWVVKLSWTGYGWITPSAATAITTTFAARDYVPGRWTGSRFVAARLTGAANCEVYERNVSNTTTVTRTTPTHPQGVVRSMGLGYNSITQDIRIYAVGTSDSTVYYVDYIRASASWSAWSQVSATAVLGAGVDNFQIRRGTAFNNKADVLLAHATPTPNTVVNAQLSLSYAPYAPTWNLSASAFTNGGAADVNAALLLDWDFNDPDTVNDAQSAYALSRQVGAGALAYWRASDSTWQATEQKYRSGTTQVSLASGWAAGSDANYQYKVKTWDLGDAASLYSSALVLIPSVKVNPTVVTPTAAQVVAGNAVTASWTVAEQTAYRVRLFKNPGATVVYDSGFVASAGTTSLAIPYVLDDNTAWTVGVTTRNNETLASTEVTVDFTTDYIEPLTPTATVTPLPAAGVIRVAINNPDPAVYVAAGTAANADNTTLAPAVPAGLAVTDLLLELAAIRNSGTGTPNTPAGYTALVSFGNMAIYGKAAGASESAPSQSFTGGASGATTSAQTAAFRRAGTAVVGTPATQLNGSAQHIAYPGLTPATDGCIVLLAVWKQAVNTSVTTPAGFTLIANTSSALGSGQSIGWYYQIQTTATAVSSGTITVTGGVAAISRAVLVAVSGIPTVVFNQLFRRIIGDTDSGVQVGGEIPFDGVVEDFRALSGVPYEYRVTTLGANGTSIQGAWTP